MGFILAFLLWQQPAKQTTPYKPQHGIVANKPVWKTDDITYGTSTTLVGTTTQPVNLVLYGNGANPLVTINLATGAVTPGKDYTPDVAAKAFWNAIEEMGYARIQCDVPRGTKGER